MQNALMKQPKKLLRIDKTTLRILEETCKPATSIPILKCFYLNNNEITATDMDNAVIIPCPTGSAQGLFPSGSLVAGLYEVEEDVEANKIISLQEINQKITVVSGTDYDGFPTPSNMGEVDVDFKITIAELQKIIKYVGFCMSKEETRFYLNGICYHNGKFIATDGHRLAVYTSEIQKAARFIISRRCIKILELMLKLAEDKSQYITVSANDVRIRFEFSDGTKLISKLVDGTFPEYERVVPYHSKGAIFTYTFQKAEALETANNIVNMALDRTAGFMIDPEGNMIMQVISESIEINRKIFEVQGANPETLGFNGRYFKELLKHVPKSSSKMTMSLENKNSPAIIKADKVTDCFWILMPMRV